VDRQDREQLEGDDLSRLLDAWQVPPAPDGLDERIIRGVYARAGRARIILRIQRVAGALAAVAAAVLLVVVLLQGQHGRPRPEPPRGDVDVLVEENLDFFRDYAVVANFDTLEAIEAIEAVETGKEGS